MRDRAHAALSRGDVILQAYELLNVLGDAVADCEDDEPKRLGSMTLAEARSSYEAVAYEEAVSIALEGLEVIYGESFLPDAVALPAPAGVPALRATAVTLCQRAVQMRLDEVHDELRRLDTYGDDGTMRLSTDIEAEENMLAETLRELAAVRAATPGTSAA
jgi:hypothetical protein